VQKSTPGGGKKKKKGSYTKVLSVLLTKRNLRCPPCCGIAVLGGRVLRREGFQGCTSRGRGLTFGRARRKPRRSGHSAPIRAGSSMKKFGGVPTKGDSEVSNSQSNRLMR